MAVVIQTLSGSVTVNALLTTDFQLSDATRNVRHDNGDITLIGPGPIGGTMTVLIDTYTRVQQLRTLLNTRARFSFADSSRTELNMTFVLDAGAIQTSLDDETRNLWLVTFPWLRVS